MLIKTSTVLQEYEEYHDQRAVMRFKMKRTASVKVRDCGLVGIIKGYRIKVVIRRVGDGGEFKFHSVIPAWSTRYYRDIKLVRNTKGNVADD